MHNEFGGARLRDRNFTGRKSVKSGGIAVTNKTLVKTNILTVTVCFNHNYKNDIPLLINCPLFFFLNYHLRRRKSLLLALQSF